jgi:hypothetical protein
MRMVRRARPPGKAPAVREATFSTDRLDQLPAGLLLELVAGVSLGASVKLPAGAYKAAYFANRRALMERFKRSFERPDAFWWLEVIDPGLLRRFPSGRESAREALVCLGLELSAPEIAALTVQERAIWERARREGGDRESP